MKNVYLKDDVVTYFDANKIEDFLNKSVGKIIKNRPENPFKFLISDIETTIEKSLFITDIMLIQDYDKSFNDTLILKGDITTKLHKTSFCLDLTENYKNKPLNSVFEFLCTDEQVDKEKLAETSNKINEAFNGKNVFELNEFKKIIDEIDSPIKEYLNQAFLLHFNMIGMTYKYDLKEYLSFNRFAIEPKEQENKCLLIMTDSESCSSFDYIYLKTNEQSSQANKLVYQLIEEIKKDLFSSKFGYKPEITTQRGYLKAPHNTIGDNLNLICNTLNKLKPEIELSIGIKLNPESYYENEKYNFENSKKALTSEEYEDFLIKLIGDKKMVKELIDPIIYSDHISWHRFNKKRGDKKLDIKVGMENHLREVNWEDFNNLSIEKYPSIKEDVLQTLSDNKFKPDFKTISIDDQLNQFITELKAITEASEKTFIGISKNQASLQFNQLFNKGFGYNVLTPYK